MIFAIGFITLIVSNRFKKDNRFVKPDTKNCPQRYDADSLNDTEVGITD